MLEEWSDRGFEKKFPVFFARDSRGVARKNSAAIVDFRFRHPRGGFKACAVHQQLGVRGAWEGRLDEFPLLQLAEERATFSARRYACDRDGLFGKVLDMYDVVVVDECQDLLCAQEMRLLRQTSRPLVLVGDPMQQIYTFREDSPCSACKLFPECTPDLPPALEWYGTWRLDARTCVFLEEVFGRVAVSHRGAGEDAEIVWRREPQHGDTLVLCRYRREVVEFALTHPEVRIVEGEKIAKELRAAGREDSSSKSMMATYARSLQKQGSLERTIRILTKQSVPLSRASQGVVVTTVHQAKGYEVDHCAVHGSLLIPLCKALNEEERNISFVAMTRHRKSLVVLVDAGSMRGESGRGSCDPGPPPLSFRKRQRPDLGCLGGGGAGSLQPTLESFFCAPPASVLMSAKMAKVRDEGGE